MNQRVSGSGRLVWLLPDAAKPLSPTTTSLRPGNQRRACSTSCRAQSVSFLCGRTRSWQWRSEGASAVRNGSAHTRPAQGIGTRSMRLSQRRPLALCEVPVAGAHGVAVDALGRDALAPSALDCVFDAQHDGPSRHKNVEQQFQQHTALMRGCPSGMTLMEQVCSCHAVQAQRRAPPSH